MILKLLLCFLINFTAEYNYGNMANNGEWWTAPAESEDGKTIIVTGRKDVRKFRENPKFSIRVEITWSYDGDKNGMPVKEDSEMMEKVTDLLQSAFDRDPVAVMTGIFTGDGERNWIFYTLSTNIFGKKINEALASLPLLPLKISAENDPEWQQYDEMSEAEINID